MSFAEIEAELEKLSPEELRQVAMKSWAILNEKVGHSQFSDECSEEDPAILAALDEAISKSDSEPMRGYSADQIRAKIGEWTSSK